MKIVRFAQRVMCSMLAIQLPKSIQIGSDIREAILAKHVCVFSAKTKHIIQMSTP